MGITYIVVIRTQKANPLNVYNCNSKPVANTERPWKEQWRTAIVDDKILAGLYISPLIQKLKSTPPVGLEPTTFELEVRHASPLRHGGYLVLVEELLLYQKYYVTVIIISWTMCYMYIKAYRKILVICAGSIFNFSRKRLFLLRLLSWEGALFHLP